MYSKLVLCLAAAVTAVVAAPSKLGDLSRQSLGTSTFARRTLGGLTNERNARDLSGAYSFSFETPDGIKRQQEGKPQPPTGAIAKNGAWSLIYPDGSEGKFKFVADDKGFRLVDPEPTTEERLEAAKERAHKRAESRRRLTFAQPPTL